MAARKYTPIQNCVLPSFHEFCQSVRPSTQDASLRSPSQDDSRFSDYGDTRPVPPTPTNSLTPYSSGYVCPCSDCHLQSRTVATRNQCITHQLENHARLAPKLFCNGCTGRDRAATSPSPVTPALPYNDTGVQPLRMGWFDPTTERAETAIECVKGLDRDALLRAYFKVDPSRPLYGDQQTSKKACPGEASAIVGHPGLNDKQTQSKKNHMENERDRRVLHFDFQSELHLRTPELAHQLAEKDMKMLEIRKSTSSKAPGKNDQFVSDIYMHHLSAIVVQSEHSGRKAAERRVQELGWQLNELRQAGAISGRRRSYEDEDHGDGSVRPSKKRCTIVVSGGSASALQRRSLRLPPSPSPSPSVASLRSRM